LPVKSRRRGRAPAGRARVRSACLVLGASGKRAIDAPNLSTSIIASRTWRRLCCLFLHAGRRGRGDRTAWSTWHLPLRSFRLALGAFIASVAISRVKTEAGYFFLCSCRRWLFLDGCAFRRRGCSATKEQSGASARLVGFRSLRGYFIKWRSAMRWRSPSACRDRLAHRLPQFRDRYRVPIRRIEARSRARGGVGGSPDKMPRAVCLVRVPRQNGTL